MKFGDHKLKHWWWEKLQETYIHCVSVRFIQCIVDRELKVQQHGLLRFWRLAQQWKVLCIRFLKHGFLKPYILKAKVQTGNKFFTPYAMFIFPSLSTTTESLNTIYQAQSSRIQSRIVSNFRQIAGESNSEISASNRSCFKDCIICLHLYTSDFCLTWIEFSVSCHCDFVCVSWRWWS